MAKIKDMLRKATAVLHRRGVSVDESEDLVHDAFVRLREYEKRQKVRSQEAILVRTAINISIDHARRRARAPVTTTVTGLEQFGDAQPDPFEIARARTRLQRVNEGLQEMSETSRRILLARRLDGTSVADIAFHEGMSIAAVEKQIARATLFLMKWVEEW
ncbi:sigma-70 family RNA polymerase sigma factor [Sphingobium sp. AN558]|uniref:RNA polymerase sigma factor n=1 Tax=Sphingobium sp. AN558 TaxID=3133442 RepID=UPI0030BFF167